MRTPIPELELALGGAWDFAIDTNPWCKRAEEPKRQSRADVARSARRWAETFNNSNPRRRRRAVKPGRA